MKNQIEKIDQEKFSEDNFNSNYYSKKAVEKKVIDYAPCSKRAKIIKVH